MNPVWRRLTNERLDWFAQLEVRALGRTWAAFQICGCVGFVSAVLVVFVLGAHGGLRMAVAGLITAAAVLTFLTLAMATKIIIGEEKLVYHHHEIAVLMVTALLVRLLGQPVLRYLDVTALSLGMFLVWGRIGCLTAGCCHGRPCSWGIRYGAGHAQAGFTPYYAGVRLFPVQAVESLWTLGVVAAGSMLVWNGAAAGTALACYVAAYHIGRFGLEFCRGDGVRPYWRLFSEAQWTAVVLVWCVAWAAAWGTLPFDWRYAAAAMALTTGMVAAGFKPARDSRWQLLRPDHLRELAVFLEAEPDRPDRIRPRLTSQGVQISCGRVARRGAVMAHYALSLKQGGMTVAMANTLMEAIGRLTGSSARWELVQGGRGVFHIFCAPAGGRK